MSQKRDRQNFNVKGKRVAVSLCWAPLPAHTPQWKACTENSCSSRWMILTPPPPPRQREIQKQPHDSCVLPRFHIYREEAYSASESPVTLWKMSGCWQQKGPEESGFNQHQLNTGSTERCLQNLLHWPEGSSIMLTYEKHIHAPLANEYNAADSSILWRRNFSLVYLKPENLTSYPPP